MSRLRWLKENPTAHISLFLGGHSVPPLLGGPFTKIREKTFTVGINHSFAIEHLNREFMFDALVWQDYNVTKDIQLWVRRKVNKGKRLPVLWTRESAFIPPRSRFRYDPENIRLLREESVFIPKDKKRTGSFTSGLCIDYLRTTFSDRKLYIFGLDMRGKGCWYDQYFEPIKKIKKCWDLTEHEVWEKDKHTSKPVKFVRKAKEDLGRWINDAMIYNMTPNSNYKHFQKLTLEELCQSH